MQCHQHFSLLKFHLLIVRSRACAIAVLFRKCQWVWVYSILSPLVIFRVSGFKLGSVIHFQLRFGQIETKECHFILLNIAIKFNQHSLSKMLPFFQCALLGSLSKTDECRSMGLDLVPQFWFLTNMPVPYCFDCFNSVA